MKTRTHTSRLTIATLGALAALAAGGSALAAESGRDNNDKAEMQKVTAAKITLADAVAKAEQTLGGKAFDAAISDEKGDNAWEIELSQADGSVKTVMVDTQSGKIDQNASDESKDKMDKTADDSEEGEDAD